MPGQLIEWPLRCGPVPPLADTSSPRPETGLGLVGKLAPGDTLILTPDGQPGSPRFPEHGGSGKTQLAAALAHGLWDNRSVDLLVWVGAASRDAILSGYASALTDLGAADPDDDLLASAQRFLTWLSRTERRWVVVLDDLADPADLDGLWPFGTDGRVVVTARQETSLDEPNRRIVPVGSFTMREALAYLTARLSTDPGQRTEALDLATDLDRQPLALAHATAALICTGASCRDYRGWFHDRRRRLGPPATDAEPGVVDVTWSLAMDLADQIAPAGFARPMLALAALLDPAGIPGVVFTSQAACGYMTGHPAMPGDPAQAREAVHNLARAGLVTINPASTTRTVQVHPLIQALTRKVIPAAEFERAARSAADALYQAWPGADVPPRLAQALRDCTTRLRDCTGDLLWTPEAHPVLLRAGESLSDSHTSGPATAYWLSMLDTAARVLGPAHAQTLRCRDGLGAAYEAADRLSDATEVYERTLAERQRALGNDHPDTLASCAHLGRVYAAAGRHGEALPMYERVVADREWVLGTYHPDTLTARGNLANAYLAARRLKDALPVYERTLADREMAQGTDDVDTLTARGNLANAYHSAGRLKDALPLYEQTLADCERVLGPTHQATLTSRANLGSAYHAALRLTDAIKVFERTLADCEASLGTGHPLTQAVRENLDAANKT